MRWGLKFCTKKLLGKASNAIYLLALCSVARMLILFSSYKWKKTEVSVQSLSCIQLFATPWTAACQASLSITSSRSPPKPRSIESVIPSNHLILCRPLLLLPSIFPRISVFSNESAFHIRWPKYWSFSFNISPSSEYPGLISLQSKGLSRVFSTPQFKSINSSVLSFLYSSLLISINDYWKKYHM